MAMKDGELHRHDSHNHDGNVKERILRFYIKAPGAYTCSGCKLAGTDPCLKCVYENCDFTLHKTCLLAKDSTFKTPPFLKYCHFDYHNSTPERDRCGNVPYCDACGLDIKGPMRFRCTDHPYDPHDLHPTCAHLTMLDRRQDENGLIYELQDKVKSKCLHCGKRYPAEECIRFTGWKWVCTNRKWSFPICFTGRSRTLCYHIKCMNEIQSSTGESRVSTKPELEYFYGELEKCFTDVLTSIQDSVDI